MNVDARNSCWHATDLPAPQPAGGRAGPAPGRQRSGWDG